MPFHAERRVLTFGMTALRPVAGVIGEEDRLKGNK